VDPRGARHEEERDVDTEMWDARWPSAPVPGSVSVFDLCRHYEEHGDNPPGWVGKWLRPQGVGEHDRVGHDIRALGETLWYGDHPDQLDMVSVASLGVVARRRRQIIDAYRRPGGPPDWHFARYPAGQ
jgi:hypothetical protein